MKPSPAQIHKLKQAIAAHGVEYQFKRKPVDTFGDAIPNAAPVTQVTLNGMFTETGTGFILITSEAATVHSKPTPAITAMFEDAVGIQQEDLVQVPQGSGPLYKVTSVNDLGNFGYFASIALEVILDGIPV